jgi:hypothetical protein
MPVLSIARPFRQLLRLNIAWAIAYEDSASVVRWRRYEEQHLTHRSFAERADKPASLLVWILIMFSAAG